MSLIAELRSIISEAVTQRDMVSGIDIVARFDWEWHTIPTLNEFRQAVRKIPNLQISKDAQGVLQFSANAEHPNPIGEIAENDIQVIYEAYIKEARKK